MTPIFRAHLALFFRVTEKPLQALYYKMQIVVLKWRDIRHKTTKKFLLARVCIPETFCSEHKTVILIDTIWCQCCQFVNLMTLFFPQFLLPFDKVCQLYALVLQSSMRGNVEMAINKLVFFVLALGQTFMGIDPVLMAVESGSKFSYSRSYILDLELRYKSCSLNHNWSWILYYFFYCKRCYLDRDNYISDSFLLRWILQIFCMHNSFICFAIIIPDHRLRPADLVCSSDKSSYKDK